MRKTTKTRYRISTFTHGEPARSPRRALFALAASGLGLLLAGVLYFAWFGLSPSGGPLTVFRGNLVSPTVLPGLQPTKSVPTQILTRSLPAFATTTDATALVESLPQPTAASTTRSTPTLPEPTTVPKTSPKPDTKADPRVEASVDAILTGLNSSQKVGQLLMFGFTGTDASSAASVIKRFEPGAIVFVANTTSPAQTQTLTRGIGDLARAGGPKAVPPIIAIDHEGGKVQRLTSGVTFLPSMLVLGATHSESLARLEGEVAGRELRSIGITMTLGPDLDVDVASPTSGIGEYERSLGSDPSIVGTLGAAYIAGIQSEGVIAVAKHYPGLGSANVDSHLGLPVTARDRAALDATDLVPFRQVAPTVGAIMAAHIQNNALDARFPASLSPVFLSEILRHDLGFDGIILTDELGGMKAITDNFDIGSAAVQSVRSGADIVLIAGPIENQANVYQALLNAVETGAIPQEQLDQSVRRVLRAKVRAGVVIVGQQIALPYRLSTPPDPRGADTVRQIAESAITVVQDSAGQLPVQASKSQHVLVLTSANLPAADGGGTLLGKAVRKRVPDTRELVFSMDGADDTTALADAARGRDLVIVGSYDAGPWQQKLVRGLREHGAKPIVVGFWRPEEVTNLPADTAYIAAYSPRAELVDAAVKVLFGEIRSVGCLPVTLSPRYPAGRNSVSSCLP